MAEKKSFLEKKIFFDRKVIIAQKIFLAENIFEQKRFGRILNRPKYWRRFDLNDEMGNKLFNMSEKRGFSLKKIVAKK